MARPLWSGSISFGLVQIPVGMTSAITSAEALSFTLLDKADNSPIGYKQFNKTTGEEVPGDRRVKGYEVAKNEYVILDEEDFKRANVKATETIDIHSFVELASIPLVRFEKPYFLAPQKRGLKAYALLQQALAETGKVAIATMVMRQRQHLCAVIPRDGGLLLEMLHEDHELSQPEALELPEVTPAEVKMAVMLIEGMSEKTFDTSAIKDTYRDDLLALIEARRDNPGRAPTAPAKPGKEKAASTDIMALLKASVARHKGLAVPDDTADTQGATPAAAVPNTRRAAHWRPPGARTAPKATTTRERR